MKRGRLGLGVLLALLVVLSGQAHVGAQAAGPPITVTGTFAMISGDPLGGGEHRYVFTLTDDAGREHRLGISEAVGRGAGGVTNLSGKRVTVTGAAQGAVEPGGPSVIAASSITAETTSAAPAAAPEALAGAQKFVTILCRFADSTGTTPRTPAYVEGLLGDSFPGISHFWRENSYNLVNNVGSVVKGWYNLPQPRAYYVPGGNLEFGRAAEDCTAAADPVVDFNQYVGINLLFNETLDCCAWGGGWTLTRDGTTKVWPTTWMPPWGYADQSVLGHEMGHAYGLPHSSGNYGVVYDSYWDVMSWGGRNLGTPHPTYGRLGTHTISYHKDRLGWIPAARRFTAAANSCAEINIDNLEQVPSTAGNYLMAVLPVSGTRFYTVEARTNRGYDTGRIPGEAIVIHDVDTTRNEPAHVVDASLDNNPNDAGAMWLPGETFTDGPNAVKVEVLASTASGWRVRVTKGSAHCGGPPPAPKLISPGSTGTANPVTYRWNSAPGATWYRLYVSGPGGVRETWVNASTAGCAAGGVCQAAPTGSAENLTPWTLAAGSYTWWTRGWASNVTGPWSAGMSFTVGVPVAPVTVSPHGVAAPNPVTYRWNAVPGAAWYRLWVNGPGGVRAQWFTAAASGCPSGAGVCQVTPTGNAESSIPWKLTSGVYTWYVLGQNANGNGPWSSAKSFTGVAGSPAG